MRKIKGIINFVRLQGWKELLFLVILLIHKRLAKYNYHSHSKILSILFYNPMELIVSRAFSCNEFCEEKKLFSFTYEEIANYQKIFDQDALIKDCDLLLENKLIIGFDYILDFEQDNYFVTDCWTGEQYSNQLTKDNFFKYIASINGDPRSLWEVNRLQYLVLFAQGFILTKNRSYLDKAISIVQEWIKQNPYKKGINWLDTQEVGIRMTSLIVSKGLFESRELENKESSDWDMIIEQHAHFVYGNLSIGKMTHNHYLTELTSLLIFSLTCNNTFKYKYSWFYFSKYLLLREVSKQLNEDGLSAEGSTSYTLFDYDAIVMANYFYQKIFGQNLFPGKTLLNMMKVIEQFTVNDRDFVKIGDADCGRYNRLNWQSDLSRTGYISVVEQLFLNQHKSQKERVSPELFWFSPKLLSDVVQEDIQLPESYPVMFPDTGCLSYKRNDRHFIIRFGPPKIKPGVRFSHTHSDYMSFTFYEKGRALFIDPGTLTYLGENSQREYLRSANQHNTVTLDGNEFVDIKKYTFGLPSLNTVVLDNLEKVNSVYMTGARYYYDKDTYIGRRYIFDLDLNFILIINYAKSSSANNMIETYCLNGDLEINNTVKCKSLSLCFQNIYSSANRAGLSGSEKMINAIRYGVKNKANKFLNITPVCNGKVLSITTILFIDNINIEHEYDNEQDTIHCLIDDSILNINCSEFWHKQ